MFGIRITHYPPPGGAHPHIPGCVCITTATAHPHRQRTIGYAERGGPVVLAGYFTR